MSKTVRALFFTAFFAGMLTTTAARAADQGSSNQDATISVADSKPLKVLGTKVFLSPPPGFVQADRFTGFIKKDDSASIIVTEIPGAYAQVTSFTKNDLAGKGINLTTSTTFNTGKREASLIEFTQMAAGKKFKKVACFFGDQITTTVVTGTMPENGSSSLFDSIRQAVKSARYDPHARLSGLEEGLPFTIADSKKFKKATRLQNTLLFTTTGKVTPGKDNGPLFIVGQSVNEGPIENHEAFARERLERTKQVKNIIIDKQRSIKQSGLDGEEFLASGVDAEDGVPTYIFHTILFDNDGYFIFQGLCPAAERAVFEPEYQKLVQSFHLR